MIRHISLWSLAVTVCGLGLASVAGAEPPATPEKAPKKDAAPAKPATEGKKSEGAATPPDLTGVWKGRIVGMPGGGGGGPGGGRGKGGRGRGGGGGGGRQSEIELTIDAKTIKGRELGPNGGRSMGAGKYELTGTGAGNLDTEQTEGRDEGTTFVGIYELKGDELKWSVTRRHLRPKGFTAQGGNYVLILKRQKS
jgi:hypothetical protein